VEIVEGPGAGTRSTIDAATEVGRGDGPGLRLDDDQVSRRHALLTPVDGGLRVEDLGSRNGTYINGQQIFSPTLLTPGDQLQLGVTLIELRTADEVARGVSGVHAAPPAFLMPERAPDYQARIKPSVPELDPLLDARVKARARLAPLAVFVLAALVVMVFLAERH
jgi:hypothetical protein